MGGHLFLPCNTSRPLLMKLLAPYLYNPIKRYSQGNKEKHCHIMEERAPSLADEFKRVAEEKAKAEEESPPADQGFASKATEKAFDGTEEATNSSGDNKRGE